MLPMTAFYVFQENVFQENVFRENVTSVCPIRLVHFCFRLDEQWQATLHLSWMPCNAGYSMCRWSFHYYKKTLFRLGKDRETGVYGEQRSTEHHLQSNKTQGNKTSGILLRFAAFLSRRYHGNVANGSRFSRKQGRTYQHA